MVFASDALIGDLPNVAVYEIGRRRCRRARRIECVRVDSQVLIADGVAGVHMARVINQIR